MANTPLPIRIGIYGNDNYSPKEKHGCGLWPAGYASVVTAGGGEPVPLAEKRGGPSLDELMDGVQGLVLAGHEPFAGRQVVDAEWLCEWAKKHQLPLLAIDHGMHSLNATFNGTLYMDLSREVPEALQHRHPPEKGLRHAIEVIRGTRMAQLYGEGEVVVNSEHRRGVARLAKGFRMGAKALDGVVEAIEFEAESWFAVGVQWHPASSTASGLDIQLFRGLIDECRNRLLPKSARPVCVNAA
jgi:putative glutamine amidotransferase